MILYDTSMSMHKKKENICLCSMGISPGASGFFTARRPCVVWARMGSTTSTSWSLRRPASSRWWISMSRWDCGIWYQNPDPLYIYIIIYIIYITYIFVYIIYTCDRYVIENINDNNSNSDLNNNGNNNIDTLWYRIYNSLLNTNIGASILITTIIVVIP